MRTAGARRLILGRFQRNPTRTAELDFSVPCFTPVEGEFPYKNLISAATGGAIVLKIGVHSPGPDIYKLSRFQDDRKKIEEVDF